MRNPSWPYLEAKSFCLETIIVALDGSPARPCLSHVIDDFSKLVLACSITEASPTADEYEKMFEDASHSQRGRQAGSLRAVGDAIRGSFDR